MKRSKLTPFPIIQSSPMVEVNKEIFTRLQQLYNQRLWTEKERQEWKSLLHLILHTHKDDEEIKND